ncbi:sugar phosphate isomerase/epimerase [Rhodococcus xishaensis]|uniref:Sugar phosphate isomerase/epimerase n=1 Tax=Rhodococcus xishaensis TaxID=2487364 RepID=A0A3S3A9B7_9NOCA|nr:sugar phosphate isomerase/epimerase [Rhodococcus xishaensis]
MDLTRCSLNSATVKGTGFNELAGLAEKWGFRGVGLWRDVLEDLDLAAASRRLQHSGLRVSSVCRGGMFPQPDEQSRRRRFDDNRAAVDQAHILDADCLYLVCGPPDADLADARQQIHDGIVELEPYARQAGVRLAVEPFHPMMASTRSAITSLGEANDLVEKIASDGVGIAVDSYHVWWDVRMHEEIRRAASHLFSVQLADWITPIEGELSSRGMPGEGSIDLQGFVTACNDAGYRGLVEVEVLSSKWWSETPDNAIRGAVKGLLSI